MKRRLALVALAGAAGLVASRALADLSADQTPFYTHRGLWIDRWSYNNAIDITTMLDRAASIGITDVMFQVRGQADAYYYKNKDAQGNVIEVYGTEQDPISAGYDPLQIAVTEAHKRGIRLHAWTNISPIWRGTTAPGNPQHLYYTHDEYRIRKMDGTPQPLNSGYTTMNITRADVQAHTRKVLNNIAAQYDVDGIYLDYIRFYENHSGTLAINYPSDSETTSRFTAETGLTFTNPTTDPNRAAYKAWLASKISNLVRDLRSSVHDGRESTHLQAAVWRDASIGLNDYQQDWKTWMEQGYLDAAMPMIYRKGFGSGGTNMDSDSGDLFRLNTTSAMNYATQSATYISIATYMQDNTATAYNNVMAQLNYLRDRGANGFDIYDYSVFNGTAAQNEALRAVTDFINANKTAPATNYTTNFESGTNNEGYFQQNITYSGSNRNIASGSADAVTTEMHAGARSQQIIINKTAGAADFLARHVSGTPTAAEPASNLTCPSIGSLGFWLKTSTPDLQVAPAVDDNTANTSTERGYFQNVIADGQWHKYEWMLNDHTHWDAWAGASADGAVASQFTLDSIQFLGTADSNTIFLDDVFYDAAATAPDQWKANADGTWSNSLNWTARQANWTAGNPPTVTYTGGVPDSVGAVANLRRRATSARTITLDAPVTLGTLNFDNSNSYTLDGQRLTMDVASGSAAINVLNRGSHTIASPITLSDNTSIFVDRGSTLTASAQIMADGVDISKTGDGALRVRNVRAKGLTLTSGKIAVLVNGSDSGVSYVSSLSVAPGASLDLNDNDLVVEYGTAPSVFSAVRALVTLGYSASPDVSKTGIISSTGQSAGNTILALIDNALVGAADFPFGSGHAIAANSVIGKYAYFGDSNLDGVVTSDDYALLDANLGTTPAAGIAWLSGDANGDGSVTSDDYAILDGTLGSGSGSPLAPPAGPVPEPSAVILSGLGLLLHRRRRN